jgi:hypothetical protein
MRVTNPAIFNYSLISVTQNMQFVTSQVSPAFDGMSFWGSQAVALLLDFVGIYCPLLRG